MYRRFEDVDDPHCNCAHDCPGISPCICIAIYSNEHGTCMCWCPSEGRPKLPEHVTAGLDQKVDLCVNEAQLSRLGLMLAGICTADIFVPAAELDKTVELSLKKVTLESAIQAAGLIARERR